MTEGPALVGVSAPVRCVSSGDLSLPTTALYILTILCRPSVLSQTHRQHHHEMGVKIGDYDLDTSNISPADVEKLRKMLPTELQQPGRLSQLEIILEAIHYIQILQSKLTKES